MSADVVTDVAIMTRPGYAYGYRGILTASPDPFEPNFVSWTYSDQPVHVFRTSLALPAPGLQEAPLGHRSVPAHLTEAAGPSFGIAASGHRKAQRDPSYEHRSPQRLLLGGTNHLRAIAGVTTGNDERTHNDDNA